ncbi:hypothetical protein ACRW6N_27845 [Escherichia coli]
MRADGSWENIGGMK